MDENVLGYDLTNELNEFNQEKILSSIEIAKNVVMYVLFSKPGQYPSLPMIGMDINNMLYEFYDEIDCTELANNIINQCSALGYYFNDGNIIVNKFRQGTQPALTIRVIGVPTYPKGYITDKVNTDNEFLIGLTLDDFNKLVVSTN